MMNSRYKDMIMTFRALNPGHGLHTKILKPKAKTDSAIFELYVFDVIGSDWFGDGITVKSVTEAIKEAGAFNRMNIYINSPGGDVFEANAIINSIKRSNSEKYVYIEGVAASAATMLAMVGKVITTAKNGMWMIHNPWGFSMGDEHDMRATADTLSKIKSQMIDAYSARTKLPAARLDEMLNAETWMTAAEAKTNGFTDEVKDPDEEVEPVKQEETKAQMTEMIRALMKESKQREDKHAHMREQIAAMAKRARGQPQTELKK